MLSAPLSEYNFSNLYLFRKVHNYKLQELENGTLSIVGTSYDNHTFLMPLFRPKKWSDLIACAKTVGAEFLFPIPENFWPEIEQEGFSVSAIDDESDYLYEAECIRACRGRHLAPHRNIVRQLFGTHDVSCVRYTPDLLSDATSIINGWADKRDLSHESADISPFLEGVQHAQRLHIEGWLFYIDAKPVGCIFGQTLSKETYLYHFSKTASQYRGLAQHMHQRTAEDIPEQFTYLNWEQDLGIPGLRQFKRSFQPTQLLQKGRVWVR